MRLLQSATRAVTVSTTAAAAMVGICILYLPATPRAAVLAEGPQAGLVVNSSLFSADELALFRAACAYPASAPQWRQVFLLDDVLICPSGRTADHPKVRAILADVGDRIGRRVEEAVRDPSIAASISHDLGEPFN